MSTLPTTIGIEVSTSELVPKKLKEFKGPTDDEDLSKVWNQLVQQIYDTDERRHFSRSPGQMCLDWSRTRTRSKKHSRAHSSPIFMAVKSRKAKYINVVRDPKAVLVSFYKFCGWYFEPGSHHRRVAHALVGRFSFRSNGIRCGLWHKRNDADTLLDYESMAAAPEDTVRRIAGFIGFGDEEDRIQIAIEQSSLAFMSANGDDKLLRSYRNEPSGLPKTPVAPKCKVSHHKKRVSALRR